VLFRSQAGAGDFFLGETLHNGGMVGGGSSTWSRMQPAAAFAAAPRYHNGGLPGIAANERRAILEVGEEVLSKNNPRNIRNGGGQGSTARTSMALNIINTIDAHEMVDRVLSTPAGQRTLVNAIGAKRSEVKKVLT